MCVKTFTLSDLKLGLPSRLGDAIARATLTSKAHGLNVLLRKLPEKPLSCDLWTLPAWTFRSALAALALPRGRAD